jgi:hypothetical protein
VEFFEGLNEVPHIKYNGNSSSGSPAYVCRREYGQTDMTNTVGAFRDYTKGPKRCLVVFIRFAHKVRRKLKKKFPKTQTLPHLRRFEQNLDLPINLANILIE